jgi:hypothetical protein
MDMPAAKLKIVNRSDPVVDAPGEYPHHADGNEESQEGQKQAFAWRFREVKFVDFSQPASTRYRTEREQD